MLDAGGGELMRASSMVDLGEVASGGSTAILRGREGESPGFPKGLLGCCRRVLMALMGRAYADGRADLMYIGQWD